MGSDHHWAGRGDDAGGTRSQERFTRSERLGQACLAQHAVGGVSTDDADGHPESGAGLLSRLLIEGYFSRRGSIGTFARMCC